jgi:hypothetical protein
MCAKGGGGQYAAVSTPKSLDPTWPNLGPYPLTQTWPKLGPYGPLLSFFLTFLSSKIVYG